MIALPSKSIALHRARALHRTCSPDKRHPSAHIVDVPALRLPHVCSREKMHIGRDPAHVTVDLPLGTDLGRCGDVPPDHVAPERHEHIVSWQQLQCGMDVDEVARANETGIIEISRLEIEWIKS